MGKAASWDICPASTESRVLGGGPLAKAKRQLRFEVGAAILVKDSGDSKKVVKGNAERLHSSSAPDCAESSKEKLQYVLEAKHASCRVQGHRQASA